MAITYQGDYKAVVKEGPENEPIIIFEVSDGKPIPGLKGEVIGIHLKPGASNEDAEDIVRAINQHMSSFFLTSFKE
jgi:hypothetical protein